MNYQALLVTNLTELSKSQVPFQKNEMIIQNKLMQIEDVVNGLCETNEDEEEYEEALPTIAENAG